MLNYQIHTSGPAQKAPQMSSIEVALKEFLRTEAAVSQLMASQHPSAKICAASPADAVDRVLADHTMSMSLSLPTLTSPHPLGSTSLAAIGGGRVTLGNRPNLTIEEALEVIAERVGCLSAVGVGSTSLPANSLLGGALEWSLAEDHLLVHLGAQHEDLLRGYLRARESMPDVFPKPFDVWKEAAQIVQPDTQSRRSISTQRQSLAGGASSESVFPECLLSDRYRILTTTKVRKELLAKMPYILAPLIEKGASMRNSAMAGSFNGERTKSRSLVDNSDLIEARNTIRGTTRAATESMTVQLFNSDMRETPSMGAQIKADGAELKKCCALVKALSDGGHGLSVPIDTADPSWNTLLTAEAVPGQDVDAKGLVLDPTTVGNFIQLAQCPQAIQRFMDKDAEYNAKTARTLDELLSFRHDLESQRQFADEATSTVKRAHTDAIKGRFEEMMERDIASLRGAYSAHIAREVRVVEEAWDGHRSRINALFEFDNEYLSRSVAAFLPSNLRAHHSNHEALIQVMSDDFGLTVGDLLCGADPFNPTGKMSLSVAAKQASVESPGSVGTFSGEHFIKGSGIAKMLVLSQAFVAPALHESVVKYAASVCSEGSQLRVALAPGAAGGRDPSLCAAIVAQQRRYEFLASLMCLPSGLCRVQELLLPQLGDRDVIAVHNVISNRVPTSEGKQTESRFKLLRTDRQPKSWEAQALVVAAEEVSRRAAGHIQLARALTADVRAAIQHEVQEWWDTNIKRAKEVLGDEDIDLCYVPPITPLEGVSKAAAPFIAWGGIPTAYTDGAASSDTTTFNLIAVSGMAGVSLAAIKCNPQDVPYLVHNSWGSAKRPAADSTVVSASEDTWGTYTSAMLHTPNEPVRLVSSHACTIGHSASPTVFEVTLPAVETVPSGTRGIPFTMAVGLILANNDTNPSACWGAGGVLWYSSGLLVIDGTRCSTGASYHHGDTLGVELGMLDGQVSLYRNGKKVLPVPGGSVSPIPLDTTGAPPSANLHVIRPPLLRLVPGRTYNAALEMFVPAAVSAAPASPTGGGLRGGSLRGRDIGTPICSPALEGCIAKALPTAVSAHVATQERVPGLQLPPTLAEAVVNLDGPFTHFSPSGVCSFQIGCFM